MSEVINAMPFTELLGDREKEEGIWGYSGTMTTLLEQKLAPISKDEGHILEQGIDGDDGKDHIINVIFGRLIPTMSYRLKNGDKNGTASIVDFFSTSLDLQVDDDADEDVPKKVYISLEEIFDSNDDPKTVEEMLNSHIRMGIFPRVYEPLSTPDKVDQEEKYGAGVYGPHDIGVIGGTVSYQGHLMAWVVWNPNVAVDYENAEHIMQALGGTIKVNLIEPCSGPNVPEKWGNRFHIDMEYHPFNEIASMLKVFGFTEYIDDLLASGALKLPFVESLLKKMSESADISNKVIEKLSSAQAVEAAEDPEPEPEVIDDDGSIMERAIRLYAEINKADETDPDPNDYL